MRGVEEEMRGREEERNGGGDEERKRGGEEGRRIGREEGRRRYGECLGEVERMRIGECKRLGLRR